MTGLSPEILELAREEATDSLDRIEQTLLAVEGGSPAAGAIDALFRDAHSIKGTAGMIGLHDAASIANAMEDRLEICREAGAFPVALVDPMLRAGDALRRAVAGEPVDVSLAVGSLGEPAPAAPPAPAVPPAPVAPVAPAGNGTPPPAAPEPPAAVGRAIRVSAEKVDRMLDAVGETVLHHQRLEQHSEGWALTVGRDVAEEELGTGGRLLGELQDAVIEMRTLPLSSITAPFPRAVRDLARAAGKEVELVITGDETPLDRVILEGIAEMIIHLARNAIAHGIEDPDERERRGKPRVGRVELRAEQRGSMVALELADDGRGVTPELLARAEAAGSLTELLCAPGFSTAESVTDIAGRGVGLDAVKRHVEGLGGSLEVRSEPQGGMTVVLLLPLTLALLRVLMCERGGQLYGLPLASVREVVTVTETASLGGRRSLELRGESIALVDLAGVLGLSGPPLRPAPPAMVVALPSRVAAVACDRVLGDREVVVKALGPLLADAPGYLGAAILEDSRVALILDPSHVLKPRPAAVQAATDVAVAEARLPSMVLVVDDHFTVRELQRSILESAGYRVLTSRDGREALARIIAEPEIDMVLTDIQMPEMDGFALLKAIRESPEHASLPVAIVTSLAGDEHRRRGAEEGADAFIVKQEFDQRTLLDTVGRLVRP